MSAQTGSKPTKGGAESFEKKEDFVTFVIAEQLFGVPVMKVQDVLSSCRITRIPLAPPEIAGSLNLRGRVVTAINVRLRLGLPSLPQSSEEEENNDKNMIRMSIVVEHGGELYSLMVDSVGEVLALSADDFERNPPTLNQNFRNYSSGIYRLNEKLLVVLDVTRLLDYDRSKAA